MRSPDETNVRCLSGTYDVCVGWSPDGTKFAAISSGSGKAEARVMDIDWFPILK